MFNVRATDSSPGIAENESYTVVSEDNKYYYLDGYEYGYLKLFFVKE